MRSRFCISSVRPRSEVCLEDVGDAFSGAVAAALRLYREGGYPSRLGPLVLKDRKAGERWSIQELEALEEVAR